MPRPKEENGFYWLFQLSLLGNWNNKSSTSISQLIFHKLFDSSAGSALHGGIINAGWQGADIDGELRLCDGLLQ